MGFLGEVTTLDGAAVRPHDIEIADRARRSPARVAGRRSPGCSGSASRCGVTVLTDDGEEVIVTLTRTHARALGLEEGQHVWLPPPRRHQVPAMGPSDQRACPPLSGGSPATRRNGGLTTTIQDVRRGPARRTSFRAARSFGQRGPPVASTSRS